MSQGQGGYNNQQRKQRYQGGGSGGDYRQQGNNNSGQHGRPRKNYPALREKYLAQARDALASGDRVLAENYFQHADHCYRMMVEEGYNTRNNYTPPPANAEQGEQQPGNEQQENPSHDNTHHEEAPAPIGTQLPAFLTANFDSEPPKPVDPANVQNWEERDAQ